MVYQEEIQIKTTGHRHMQDLTAQVASAVLRSRLSAGIVTVFNVGSTGAMGTIEFEPGLEKDLPEMLDKLFPPSRDYRHEKAWADGNGHSHLQATTLGPSITVPFKEQKLVLGGSKYSISSATSSLGNARLLLLSLVRSQRKEVG